MLKRFSVLILVVFCLAVFSSYLSAADKVPDSASVSGKYSNLIQVMNCPKDRSTYGDFRDYGYWGGGPWCGQTGKKGYWVWVSPNWYVWADKGSSAGQTPPQASVNGKYSNLIQVMNCPKDRSTYGDFRDYGHWGGGPWCGQTGKKGYWVWVSPNWYVWADKGSSAGQTPPQGETPPQASVNGKYSDLIQVLNCPNDRSSYGDFNDYGYWGGGPWCGQTGKAGYWVWVSPNWYVWKNQIK